MSRTISDYGAAEDLSDGEWEDYREKLQDKYSFYIMNPPYQKGVEYSLWIREDGYEYPILSSNTGGFVTFNSRHETVGEGIDLTDSFLSLLGFGTHEAMCFMPDLYFKNEFERSVERAYDGQLREYEVWAAEVLIRHFTMSDEIGVPELEPLANWASQHTEFGVPAIDEVNGEDKA